MNIEKKELNNLHAAISIVLEKNDYEQQVEKSLRDLKKQVQIKGFRPGMVPMPIVSKLYKKSVLLDEVEKIIQKKLQEYLDENKINTLGMPILSENNFDKISMDEDPQFEVTFEIGIKPEIQIKLSKRDKVPHYKIQVDENSINEYLNYFKRSYGQNIDIETSDENSSLVGKISTTDENGANHIFNPEGTVLISMIQNEKIKKSFIGKKVEDSITFDAEKAFSNKKDLALLLKIKEDEIQPKLKLTLEITKITNFKEAEFNQELWDKIYGKDVVTSYEQFIEKIKTEIEKQRKTESEYKLHLDIKKKLLSKTTFDLPEEFLKKQLKLSDKKEISDEIVESEFPLYVNAVKEQLLYHYLQKEHDIKITDEDMFAGAKKIVVGQFRQYGINQLPDDYLNQLALKVLQNEKEKDRIIEMQLDEKIINFVKELITLDEQEISFEEFTKKNKEEK
jgi:trigger factor